MSEEITDLTDVSVLDRPSAEDADRGAAFHRRLLWGLIVVGGGVLWLLPIRSSFWIDELVTWWVVKDSLHDTFHRAFAYQGQSILYYPLEWAVRHVGHAEWFLRLPSMIAMVGAAYLLYRCALRLADRETALLSVLVFVLWSDIVFEVSNARPYALATLATVAATWALVRWLDRATVPSAIVYVLLAASVAYAHVLFALVLPAHIVYAAIRHRDAETRVGVRGIVAAFATIAILDLGLIFQLLALWDRHGALTLESELSVEWLSSLIVPASVVLAIVFGTIVARWLGIRFWVRSPVVARSTVILVLAGTLIPLLFLALLAVFSPVRLVETRYTMAAAPFAIALCAGVLRSIHPRRARSLVCVGLVAFSLMASWATTKRAEEWREAAVRANSLADEHTVMFIRGGLIEASDVHWFDDPERLAYLMSPTSYYHFDGQLLPFAYDLNDVNEDYVASQLASLPTTTDRIVAVFGESGVPLESYLGGRLEATGWRQTFAKGFGQIIVVEWVREPA